MCRNKDFGNPKEADGWLSVERQSSLCFRLCSCQLEGINNSDFIFIDVYEIKIFNYTAVAIFLLSTTKCVDYFIVMEYLTLSLY